MRRVKRRIVLSNPVIDFSQLLLIDQPYPSGRPRVARTRPIHRMGHRRCPAGGCWCSTGCIPAAASASSSRRQPGSFWRPDLSFDGKKVLFCFKPHDEKSFHLYEINLDGSGLRQLTDSDYDDIDPIYLPDGHILFTTTRGNTYVRCGPYHLLVRPGPLRRRRRQRLPDQPQQRARLRAGAVERRPGDLLALGIHGQGPVPGAEPVDDQPGRHRHGRASGATRAVWPDHLSEPRPIPGSRRVMFSGVGHHDWFRLDRDHRPGPGVQLPARADQGHLAICPGRRSAASRRGPARIADYHASGRFTGYKTAYPLSEEDFLVSARGEDDKFRLYLMDVHGNRELIYEGVHNVWHAIPSSRARVRPGSRTAWPGPARARTASRSKPGVFYSADVYQGVPELPRGSVKYLRVFQLDSKTYSTWKKTFAIPARRFRSSRTEASSGSSPWCRSRRTARCTSRPRPESALSSSCWTSTTAALHTMRRFTGLMPGERRGCVGCHEMHSTAPPAKPGLALRRPPTAAQPAALGHREHQLRAVRPARAGSLLRRSATRATAKARKDST